MQLEIAVQKPRTFNGVESQPLNIIGTVQEALVNAAGKEIGRLREIRPSDKYLFIDHVDAKGKLIEDETSLIFLSKAIQADLQAGKLSVAQVPQLQVNQWADNDGNPRYTAMYYGSKRGHMDTKKLLAAAKTAAQPTKAGTATAEVLAFVL